MQFSEYRNKKYTTKISKFESSNLGEIHAIATIDDSMLSYAEQLDSVADAIKSLVDSNDGYVPVFVRLLLSDASNQANLAVEKIKTIVGNAAVAYIQQPPLHGAKIAALVYLRQNIEVEPLDSNTVVVRSNGYTHLYTANVINDIANTYQETILQLSYLETMLSSLGLNIADNCVRTWFYVQNIDVNYAAVVAARRDNFDVNGLTIDTHYISSTGICGRHAKKEVTSVMDAYSVGGIQPGQMKFLYASDHLNRTSDYGVTFERGTTVDYNDRRHILISGTASIDNKGSIVAEGDIKAQTLRMIENVRALLAEGGASFGDIAHIVCYLRDTADYKVVSSIMKESFGEVPCIITLAPVCRPGWLIEMECMAIVGK